MFKQISLVAASALMSSLVLAQSSQSSPPSIQLDTQRLSQQSGNLITIEGTFEGETGSGVAIDSYDGLIPSCVFGNRFIVNDVPTSRLPRNVLDAQLFSPSSKDSVTKAAQILPSLSSTPYHLTSDEDCGVAPYTTTFRLEAQSGASLVVQAIDTNGDGQFDMQLPEPSSEFTLTISQPGIHRIKAILTDGTTVSRPVIANTESNISARATPSLELFIDSMKQNDADAGSVAFLRSISDQTKASLNATLATYPDFGEQLTTPELVSVSGELVSFLIAHESGSLKRASIVELILDRTGVWRISTM